MALVAVVALIQKKRLRARIREGSAKWQPLVPPAPPSGHGPSQPLALHRRWWIQAKCYGIDRRDSAPTRRAMSCPDEYMTVDPMPGPGPRLPVMDARKPDLYLPGRLTPGSTRGTT